ncbi:hypothetical protein [Vallitalea okinawensis]|uniref:hypothetical protein n=1 Tax=Vallitalea okinawensis TaxID=2078660 RepID=UPI000CFD506A|nr:hypothetical protein [Vallitalea okinawensis]
MGVLSGIAFIIISLFIILWLVGKRRFGDITKELSKKTFPFKDFIGIGLLVLEIIQYPYKIQYDKKMIKKFEGLYGTQKAYEYYKLYLGEKITFCLLLIFLFAFLSLIYLMQSYTSSYQMVDNSFFREKDVDHLIPITMVIEDGERKIEEDINLVVPKMDKSLEEMEKRVSQVVDRLSSQLEQMTTLDHSIGLPKVINGVTIRWKSDNPTMDHSGNIHFDQVPEEGVNIRLIATLTYLDYSDTLESTLRIMPEVPKEKSLEDIAKEVQEGLDTGRYTNEKSIKLPTSLSNEGVQIYWKERSESNVLQFFSFGILISFLVFFVRDEDIKRKIKKKDDAVKLQFPDMIIKFTLLINAGMTTYSAWNKVCMDYVMNQQNHKKDMPMYEEMLVTLSDMKGGVSEYDAYERLGQRVSVREVKKFSNILTQTLHKGNKDLIYSLQNLGQEAWEERVVTAKRLGEEASSKLLFPMMILLIIIIIIVMTPALMSLNI